MGTAFCEFCGGAVPVQDPERYVKFVHEVAKDVVRCPLHKRSSLAHYKCRTHSPDTGEILIGPVPRQVMYGVHELHSLFVANGKAGGPGFKRQLLILLDDYGAWKERQGIGEE